MSAEEDGTKSADRRSDDVRIIPKLGDIKINSLDLDALRDLDRDSWIPRQKVRSRSDGSQANHPSGNQSINQT